MKTLLRLSLLVVLIAGPVFLVSCAKKKSPPPKPISLVARPPVKAAPAPVAAPVVAESAPTTQPAPAPETAPAPAVPAPAPAPAEAKGPPNKPANHAGRAACLVCHENGTAGAPKIPANHAGRTDAVCSGCHK